MTANEQVAEMIEKSPMRPLSDTQELRQTLSEHDQECWLQYLLPFERFPAGGLHLSVQDWPIRAVCHPTNVARLLDADEEDETELIQ